MRYVQNSCNTVRCSAKAGLATQDLRVQFDEVLDNAKDLVTNERGEIAFHSTCVVAWTPLQ
jgi:hypothetical protein